MNQSTIYHPNPSECPTPKIAERWVDGAYESRELWCPGHKVTAQQRIMVKEEAK